VGPTRQREKEEERRRRLLGCAEEAAWWACWAGGLTLEEGRPEFDVKPFEFSFKNSLKFSLNLNHIQIQTSLK
jgi:hypothetical protein